MKILIVIVLLAVTIEAGNIDWTKVKPIAEYHGTPLHARLHNDAQGRITNGQTAEPEQFPYQAALILFTDSGTFFCGGSLISNRWVLTSARCTDSLSTGVDVYLGAWDRSNPNEAGQEIIYVTKNNVIVHEEWDPTELINDISLIKLPIEVEFNDRIHPISLPKRSNSYASYAGATAIASGWGHISDEASGATDKLRWIEAPIMANSVCSPWYLGSVKSTHICIKTTGGTSTCDADSGGPLVLASDEPTLIGITSFGIALGCEKGWPAVFTRTTSYVDWIAEKSGVVNN